MDILEKCVKRLRRSVARIPVKTVEPAVKKTKKHFARVKLVGRAPPVKRPKINAQRSLAKTREFAYPTSCQAMDISAIATLATAVKIVKRLLRLPLTVWVRMQGIMRIACVRPMSITPAKATRAGYADVILN
jgi:hypothetical protein